MTMTEEKTVTIAGRDFARRRWAQRLRRLRPVLYVVLVLLLLGTAVWLVFFSSVVTVRGVSVSGNQTLSAERIEKVARAPIGRPLARVDLAAIQARVESLSAVKSVSVSRSWPHTVSIDVTERTPVAVVDRGAGLQAFDDDGVLFGSYAQRPDDLPLVHTAADVKAEALAVAARVVTSLRPDIAAKVDSVDVESVDRISLHLAGGRTVMWGSAEESAEKAAVLAVLLDQKADRIDVSVPARPTTS
jgi:cell division protein FtsQ